MTVFYKYEILYDNKLQKIHTNQNVQRMHTNYHY